MSRYSYGTLISVFFIYDTRMKSRILTKLSGIKHSHNRKLVTKSSHPEVVAMEITTHYLFF